MSQIYISLYITNVGEITAHTMCRPKYTHFWINQIFKEFNTVLTEIFLDYVSLDTIKPNVTLLLNIPMEKKNKTLESKNK